MKYNVYEHFTNRLVAENLSEEALGKFIAAQAAQLNYGLFRHWEHSEKKFYDCGPVIYYAKVVK